MESLEDFTKKYAKTYVRAKCNKADEFNLAFIQHVDGDGIVLESKESGSIMLRYREETFENLIDLDPPHSGLFNHNGYALVLFKTPARQWRRGMCNENHEIYNPFRKLLNEGVYRPGFNFSSIAAMYTPRFVCDPAEATGMLSKDTHSVALSNKLMISKSPLDTTDNPIVWFGCTPIGTVKGKRFQIEDEIFQQEVEDELRRLGHAEWSF
jgi:hypothetical protein